MEWEQPCRRPTPVMLRLWNLVLVLVIPLLGIYGLLAGFAAIETLEWELERARETVRLFQITLGIWTGLAVPTLILNARVRRGSRVGARLLGEAALAALATLAIYLGLLQVVSGVQLLDWMAGLVGD